MRKNINRKYQEAKKLKVKFREDKIKAKKNVIYQISKFTVQAET